MKTVVIVHHTGDWGGGTKSLIDLCEMLTGTYKVIVCIPKGYPDFKKKIEKCGCETYEVGLNIPFVNIYSGRPPLFSVITIRSIISLKNIKRFGDEILSLNPDVVIFNTLITAVTARYLSGKTKVICIDRETLSSRLAVWIYRALLDNCLDAITCLSEYECRKIRFRKTDSLVFPDCIKLEQLTTETKESIRRREGIGEKYTVLFMGGLAKIKGTDVVLEAFDALDERFQLLFAGEMNEKKLSKGQLRHDIKYPSIYLFKRRVIGHSHYFQ